MLDIKQNPIIEVKFDLCKILGRQLWRTFLREARRRHDLNQKNEVFWQRHPTLIFLWVLGGNEFIQRATETVELGERD